MTAADLRPMSIGEVLDRTFSLYKRNFWLFVSITALPFLALFAFRVGLAAFSTGKLGINPDGKGSIGLAAGAAVGLIVGGIAYLVLVGAAQAATIFAVSDLYLGRAASARDSYRRVGAKFFRVLLVLLIVGLSVGVGFVLLIVPGFILLCRTAVSVPASMLEDTRPIASIERSMELTKGHGWQIFLIFLLVWVMSYVVAIIFQVPFLILAGIAASAHHTLSFGVVVLQNLGAFLSEVLVSPIGTIAFSLMYYNLRVRKEAFDVQHLMASLEAQPAAGALPTH